MATPTFSLTRRAVDLRFRLAMLESTTWETDAFVRARLRGPQLSAFESPGADDHVRLFFPGAPVESVEQLRESPSREYTPRSWGDEWLDIEFAIHGTPGHRGIAAEWAATAEPGAAIGVGGPRGSLLIEGAPEGWFLAGDETAVPAIRRHVEAMGSDAVGMVLVEVPDPDHELTVPAPAGVHVEYVHRGAAPAGSALATAFDGLAANDLPRGDIFAFVAAEQSVVKSARGLLIGRRGLAADRIVVKGYWKRGEPEYHAPH